MTSSLRSWGASRSSLTLCSAFENADCVDEIILVGRVDRLAELRELCGRAEFKKVRHVISGGVHRQDSVQAGLNLLGPGVRYVAVHDAARPLITGEQIGRVFAGCRIHGAAALAEPITDTLKRADEEGFVCGGVDRAGLYAMQTPQIFSRDLLVEAYEAVAAKKLSITDEVSAVEQLGAKVLLVPSDEFNLKITYPRDLELAQSFLNRQRFVVAGSHDPRTSSTTGATSATANARPFFNGPAFGRSSTRSSWPFFQIQACGIVRPDAARIRPGVNGKQLRCHGGGDVHRPAIDADGESRRANEPDELKKSGLIRQIYAVIRRQRSCAMFCPTITTRIGSKARQNSSITELLKDLRAPRAKGCRRTKGG